MLMLLCQVHVAGGLYRQRRNAVLVERLRGSFKHPVGLRVCSPARRSNHDVQFAGRPLLPMPVSDTAASRYRDKLFGWWGLGGSSGHNRDAASARSEWGIGARALPNVKECA